VVLGPKLNYNNCLFNKCCCKDSVMLRQSSKQRVVIPQYFRNPLVIRRTLQKFFMVRDVLIGKYWSTFFFLFFSFLSFAFFFKFMKDIHEGRFMKEIHTDQASSIK